MDHEYRTNLTWTGSTGTGYRSYPRTHRVVAPPSPPFTLSADPAFQGDPEHPNPEQLLVMAASSCQLLSFLGRAARAGVDVVGYVDHAVGVMPEGDLPVRITRIDLAPEIRVRPGTDHDLVRALVEKAHEGCYIASSLTTDVVVTPRVVDGAVTREEGSAHP
ncbi:OsmC family protein [Georgenia alba]|uniref:OsmC family protein n=1 Tax=Georgenia alba TaxID=2233858 RepID=A0ABW2Q904_9MICO